MKALGQSAWLDDIDRGQLRSGLFQRLIDEDGLSGATGNPTIFEHSITHSITYDEQMQQLLALGKSAQEIYEALAMTDVKTMADLLRPTYEGTNGQDGFVSIEVSPYLAQDTQRTLSEVRRFWATIDRPNLLVKIPSTSAGVPAIRQAFAEGININITLIFSIENYCQVAEAYLSALEERSARGQDISRIASVASFFVSRVDALVDEEFGSAILRDAASKGFITVASVEKSGQEEFEFAYGEDFAQHIEAFHPTFAKVLVRYNLEGDVALNQRQASRLKRLSDYLHRTQTLFMFELLVPASPMQLEQLEEDKNAYDLQVRPRLMMQAIQALQEAGVEPDVWKIEGLDRQEECIRVAELARRDGRNSVGLIVLGRGAERDRVVHWLKTAASVPGFIGFAVGRTSFWQPLVDFEAKRISKGEAATQIAHSFEAWIHLFEGTRST